MKTKEQLQKMTMKYLKPIVKVDVERWARENRIIGAGNAEPGRWKTSRTPYLAEPMRAVTQGGIHRIVMMCGAQLGKSELQNNIIGRFAQLDPCTIIMVQPTIEMAEDYSKTRIASLIRDTKALRRIFYNDKDAAGMRNTNQTILQKLFKGGRLVLTGSNSAASLASRPARVVLCDEVDRFALSAGAEGDPIGIIQKRMSTFWNWLLVLTSTPTIEGESRIEKEYLTGTQEQWQYECPNCKEFHLIEYHDVNLQGIWRCPDCGFDFTQTQIQNQPAKYIAQNPNAIKDGIRSFHVNGFSSPWLKWETLMKEWNEARGHPQLEKVVMNTRFGQSYRLNGNFTDETEFLKDLEEYESEVPAAVEFLTCAVDVQDNRLEFEVCGWTLTDDCYSIIKGKILSPPNSQITWGKLREILQREYSKPNSKIKIARTFIDSGGHFTSAVYQFCAENLVQQVFPIKGIGLIGTPAIHKMTQLKSGLTLIIIGVNACKDEIFANLQTKYHFPANRGYDEIYFKQLTAEVRVMKMKNGIMRGVWENVHHKSNEALDLKVYNYACSRTIDTHKKKTSTFKVKAHDFDIWT